MMHTKTREVASFIFTDWSCELNQFLRIQPVDLSCKRIRLLKINLNELFSYFVEEEEGESK